MRVQVDETRDQGVSGELGTPRGGVAAARLRGGENLADVALVNDDNMVLEDRLRRIDWNDPVGLNNQSGGISQADLLGF